MKDKLARKVLDQLVKELGGFIEWEKADPDFYWKREQGLHLDKGGINKRLALLEGQRAGIYQNFYALLDHLKLEMDYEPEKIQEKRIVFRKKK